MSGAEATVRPELSRPGRRLAPETSASTSSAPLSTQAAHGASSASTPLASAKLDAPTTSAEAAPAALDASGSASTSTSHAPVAPLLPDEPEIAQPHSL